MYTIDQLPTDLATPCLVVDGPTVRANIARMAAYCREHDLIPPFCDEWVRRLLRGAGMRAQRIRTWKTSHDPAFDRKKKPSAGSTPRARRARR